MQIVIDVDDDVYNDIKSGKNITDIIVNGTILPKGHGRLGDLSKVYVKLNEAQIEGTEEYRGLGEAKQIVCDAPTIIEADNEVQINKENSNLTIPEALSGACFHGEVWIKCPHCMSGNQMMGRQALYKQDEYRVYKCDECGKLFKDR